MSEKPDPIGNILKDNQDRKENVSGLLSSIDAVLAQYGLVKGQHVARHIRKDPRTGGAFVAGQSGGSGSPEAVMAEKRTVAPNPPMTASTGKTRSPGLVKEMGDLIGTGEDNMLNPAAFTPENSVDNPDTLETIIRNLENATVEEIEEMANELFLLQRSQTRGRLAELMLKEILRRGLVKESEMEAEANEMKGKLQKAQMAAKAKPAAKPAAKSSST